MSHSIQWLVPRPDISVKGSKRSAPTDERVGRCTRIEAQSMGMDMANVFEIKTSFND